MHILPVYHVLLSNTHYYSSILLTRYLLKFQLATYQIDILTRGHLVIEKISACTRTHTHELS